MATWAVAVALAGAGTPAAYAQATTSSTLGGTTTTTGATTRTDDTSHPELAAASMFLAAFGVLAVGFLVFHDRSGAREAQLKALRLGAVSSVQGEALAAAPASLAVTGQESTPPTGVSIKATDTTIEVGQLSRELIFMVGQQETAATWGVDPAGRVTFVPAAGQHSRVQVKGATEGPADVYASTPATKGTAHHSITVEKAKTDPKGLTFLVLGSGIGAYVIAVIAVGLTAALGFVGKLSTETIAVVLGTAVGAGATAAASRSGQNPTAEKETKADKTAG